MTLSCRSCSSVGPDLREKVDSLSDLGATLAALGGEQREDLEAARSTRVPGEDRAAAAARAELEGQASERSFRHSNVQRFLWPALAAAAALIVGLVWMWDGSDPDRPVDPGETLLLSSQAQLDGVTPEHGSTVRLTDGLLISVEDADVGRLGDLEVRLLDGAGKVALWSDVMDDDVLEIAEAELTTAIGNRTTVVVQLWANLDLVHEAQVQLQR